MKKSKYILLILLVIGMITLITGCVDDVTINEYELEEEHLESTEPEGELEEATESQVTELDEDAEPEEVIGAVEIEEPQKMDLSPARQKEINIFLSKFTEV